MVQKFNTYFLNGPLVYQKYSKFDLFAGHQLKNRIENF
jgi:hypothetical protein